MTKKMQIRCPREVSLPRPPLAPADKPLRALLRKTGVKPFTDEYLEAHIARLKGDIKEPTNAFDHAVICFLNRHPYILKLVAWIIIAVIGTIAIMGPVYILSMVMANEFFPRPIGAGIAILVCFLGMAGYLARLDGLTVVHWARDIVYPWSDHMPDDVRLLIREIDCLARETGLRNVHYRVELPLCEKMPDPMLVVLRGDEEYYLKAWV